MKYVYWLSLGCLLCGSVVKAAPSGSAAPTSRPASGAESAIKQVKEGEMTADVVGTRKDKLNVGKIDPPAAFALEDIQNFPEDRLQPVLNNPINFEEGRDFSSMMDLQDEQLIHPWLAELSKAPFLTMKTAVEKASKDWTFSIVDQGGGIVSKQEGTGNPPSLIVWDGQDSVRDHVAVDTVYIPQLATTDRDGYRHTYMGQPAQFSAILYSAKGKTVIELSSKRLFLDKKSDLSKEAPTLLDKVCDMLREAGKFPIAIQPYDNDEELSRSRQRTLSKYFMENLNIGENQLVLSNPAPADKRGAAMAILSNVTPGGRDQ